MRCLIILVLFFAEIFAANNLNETCKSFTNNTTVAGCQNQKETTCYWKYDITTGISESSDQNCFQCKKNLIKFSKLELNDQCSCYPNDKKPYCCCIFQDESDITAVNIKNQTTTITDALNVFFVNDNISEDEATSTASSTPSISAATTSASSSSSPTTTSSTSTTATTTVSSNTVPPPVSASSTTTSTITTSAEASETTPTVSSPVIECSQKINDTYFNEFLLLKLSDFTMELNGNLTIMKAYEEARERSNLKHDLPTRLVIICFPITCLIILILYARRKCTHKVSIIKHPENYHTTIRNEDIDISEK